MFPIYLSDRHYFVIIVVLIIVLFNALGRYLTQGGKKPVPGSLQHMLMQSGQEKSQSSK